MAGQPRTIRYGTRPLLAALAATSLAATAGCGSSLGGSPSSTTTAEAVSPKQYCEEGKKLTEQVQALDRKKPEYLDTVKKLFKSFGAKAPESIADDMRPYVTYIQEVKSPADLVPENQPADLRVTTDRINTWWKQNCGRAFGS